MSADPDRFYGHGGVKQLPQQIAEGAGRVPTAEDSLRIGLLMGDAIWAAVNGPRGEFREQVKLPEAGR